MKFALACAVGCAALSPATHAQDSIFVTDAGNDRVVLCRDLNGNGNLNEAGDITVFYDDATGPYTLTNNIGICLASANRVFVCDATEDIVLALVDNNNDGDALDPGEASIYFDGRVGGNAQGILLGSSQSLFFEASTGKLWIASASGTADEIIVVRDNDNDGDANDLGEVTKFFVGSTTAYLPEAVWVDASANVFYTDIGSIVPKGVYRLTDLNSDGDASDAGESTPYFVLPITTPTPFAWSLEQDVAGWFYVGDTGNDILFRFKDLDNDGDAMDAGESSNFFVPGIASTIWDTASIPNGTIYATDGLSPDRIYRLIDANNDGLIGAGESTEMYIETGGNPVAIGNGRGIAVRPGSGPGTAFCAGDGTATACPCANLGTSGNGCANSTFASGANLGATGSAGASLATDTLALVATNVPGPGLFFQGSAQAVGGAGIVFGDGLLCVSGSLLRLGVVFPSGSTATYPGGLTPNPIHVGGATAAGDVRQYQCWYRDSASFCSVSTFNLTQGLELTWGP